MRPFYFTFCLVLASQVLGQSPSSYEVVGSSGSLSNESMSITFLMGSPLVGEDANEVHRLQYGLLYQFRLEVVLSTEMLPPEVELNVFPNPVTRALNISSGIAPQEKISIQIFDMNGRMLLESEINQLRNKTTMDLRHFQEGTYLLKVMQRNAFNTYKIIKNK